MVYYIPTENNYNVEVCPTVTLKEGDDEPTEIEYVKPASEGGGKYSDEELSRLGFPVLYTNYGVRPFNNIDYLDGYRIGDASIAGEGHTGEYNYSLQPGINILEVSLNINLMPGEYIITSSYNEANISNKVTVKAFDRYGFEFTLTGEDLLARAIQHECDHLDGITIMDHATKFYEDMTKEEKKMLRRAYWKLNFIVFGLICIIGSLIYTAFFFEKNSDGIITDLNAFLAENEEITDNFDGIVPAPSVEADPDGELKAAVAEGNVELATATYKAAVKKIDLAAARGLIHKNTAAHKKSKFTKKLNAMA